MAIVKRDGSTEPYSEEKMRKFLSWAVEHTHCIVDELYNELTIPAKDTPVDHILNNIVDVAEKLANRINTGWLKVAGRVYAVGLIKQHRANGFDLINPEDPKYFEFLESQIHNFDIFNVNIEDWYPVVQLAQELDYDYSLPINNVRMMCERQARKYNGVNETPSLVLLRQSVAASEYSKGKFSASHALEMLHALMGKSDEVGYRQAAFTHATPMAIHAGKKTRSTGSCTLVTTADDSGAIMDTAGQLALHSKHGSGNGIDISAIAGSGRFIKSTEGESNGPIPFLRIYESVLKGFNQSGKRPGAGVITFRFWHKDFEEIIYLKNTLGEPESRIRGLKYAMCTNNYLYQLAKEGKQAVLVCPKEAEEYLGDNRLLTSVGKEFEVAYTDIINAVTNNKMPGKLVDARWIFKEYFNNAYNHGNLYETNLDNTNSQNMLDALVYSSNLCTEVFIPSRYLLNKDFKNEVQTGLCFLNSTNANEFARMSPADQMDLALTQVKALDNQIETDFYPVPHTTEAYAKSSRFIGVGLSNIATMFAERDISWDSQEALEFMDKFMDDWSYAVINASAQLAQERGPASDWLDTKWAEGLVPYDLANEEAKALTVYEPDQERWDQLRKTISNTGIRNCLTMALAPTASSGAGAGLTEGQEPVEELIFTRSGDIAVTHCVNFDPKILSQYQNAFDIPNTAIIRLRAVMQKWLDQGQSISLYAKGSDFSMKEAFGERELANRLGLKSIYYTRFQKVDADNCDSCS